ncbi:hypothetical protein BD770DRAFT_16333 [Pilaira anomala]|nr:hypothetical protein BD770DRAFT_16333 [Pilaira anomala]
MKQYCLLLLLYITIVKASLFSSTDLYISSNPVIVYSNGTILDFTTTFLRQKDFKSGIIPFENLTQPSTSGLERTFL